MCRFFFFIRPHSQKYQIGEIVKKRKEKTHKPTIKWNEMTTDFICVLWLHCTTTQSSRWIYERNRCCVMCVEFDHLIETISVHDSRKCERVCSCVQLETANKHDEIGEEEKTKCARFKGNWQREMVIIFFPFIFISLQLVWHTSCCRCWIGRLD